MYLAAPGLSHGSWNLIASCGISVAVPGLSSCGVSSVVETH